MIRKKQKKTKTPKKEKKSKIIEDEILSNQSDSSGTQPTRSSTDSGNVSDSNSSNSNLVSEEVSGHSSSGERSMTSFEETPKPKKLSNRVAFFEQAIKVASTTKRRGSVDKSSITTSTKKEQFLKAVEKSESSPTPAPTQKSNERESRESAYAPIDSSESELYEYDASDPLDESPKIGLLYFTERDIRMEKKLIKKVAAEIEENGVGGVKPMLTKKLTSLEKEPIRIGIIGDSMSGKSTLIKALGGNITQSLSKFTGRIPTCYQPTNIHSKLNENCIFTELPGISDTGKYSQQNYSKTVDLDELDIVLVLTTTWFKEKHCDFGKMISKDLKKKVIFIRTKLDDSITNDRKSRPRGHDELAVVQKVRNHCIESLEKYSSSDESFFMISSMHLNRFDGAKFVRELIETMKQRDTKKINYSDVMTMSIEPTCLEVIYQKREILTERIWKISAISTVSGVLPIGGSNLTADIDLLRKEIQTYRLQFGITDDVLRASSNCPEMVEVWQLVSEGDGLLSLLRQSAMDQEWTEFSKFMNKLPLIGGNVSFAATCSVLKYCLTELCSIAIRYNDIDLLKTKNY